MSNKRCIVIKHDTTDLVNASQQLVQLEVKSYMQQANSFSPSYEDEIAIVKRTIADCFRERDTRAGVIAGKELQDENDWVMEIMLKGSDEICERTVGGSNLTQEKAEDIAFALCDKHGHRLIAVRRASFRSGV